HELVRDDFFIHDTDCLSGYRRLQRPYARDEEDHSAPLSFKVESELLIIRQCRIDGTVVTAVERSYLLSLARAEVALYDAPLSAAIPGRIAPPYYKLARLGPGMWSRESCRAMGTGTVQFPLSASIELSSDGHSRIRRFN